jgi:hypothetical protein
MYKTLVLPHVKFIPLATLKKIMSLAEEGATVIMAGGPPSGISGYHNVQENNKAFADLTRKLSHHNATQGVSEIKMGKGRIIIGADSEKLLEYASIRHETLLQQGFQFLRKTTRDNNTLYFMANGESPFEGWVSLQAMGDACQLYNAMTGESGLGKMRQSDGALEVFLQLKSQETIFIEVLNKRSDLPEFAYHGAVGNPLRLKGPWSITFTSGGPELPPATKVNELISWTRLNHDLTSSFSGAATYTISFPKPKQKSSRWLLDLGTVKESADVRLNGQSIGVLIGPVFQVYFDDALLTDENILELSVCNLMANRIAYMDKHAIFWKKFYNINFPARKPENRKDGIFDAAQWVPIDAGIIGPVRLWPVAQE